MTVSSAARPVAAAAGPAASPARAASAALEQCAAFLARLPDAAYTRPSTTIAGSTIGQHVRHALDHFAAALAGAEGGTIDYDNRRRDTPVERARAAGARAAAELAARLGALSVADEARPVRVRVMLSAGGDEAELGSTLGRELAFAAHHAIHHHAMMAAIAGELGVSVPDGFGRAPSTLHHERAPR